jgi:hypothetical protein
MESKSELCVYKMSFDGQVLKRGFWLYIWKISTSRRKYLYVGRTGDSSSANAASPFNRIGQHLDFRENAKGNAMAKRLIEKGIDPSKCEFEMLAIGPIFPEQNTKENHYPVRDTIAALECALSEELKKRKYMVLGTHTSRKSLNKQLFEKVLEKINDYFPPNLDS